MTDRKIAEQIALCTCGPELPEHMRANGKHFSNCQTELVEGIEAALAQARQEARREAFEEAARVVESGKIADDSPRTEMERVFNAAYNCVAAKIRAKAKE